MRTLRRLAFGLPWLLAAGALAQVPESLRVPLPDSEAARLTPLFPPGTKFYMLPGALESSRSLEPGDPHWFGGLNFGATTLSGDEFEPLLQTPVSKGVGGIAFVNPAPGNPVAAAALHLDTGVLWDGVQWWVYDASAETLTLQLFESCFPSGAGLPIVTLLGAGSTSANAGSQMIFTGIGPAVTIQNSLCSYHMHIRVTGVDVQPDLLVFFRARAGWFRQVSPAPMVATFTDVPTTHPFFRFVEALFASGVTAGCGAGNFCPDDPVTRGQMAVFLASALGLHFPF